MIAQPIILMIDDKPDEVDLVQEAFRFYQVPVQLHAFKTGREALDFFSGSIGRKGALPDLVLLDLNLPDMRGIEVLRMLRADPLLHDLQVQVLSGSERPNDFEKCECLGASCMLKPTDIAEYQVLVRSFEQRIQQESAISAIGPETNSQS